MRSPEPKSKRRDDNYIDEYNRYLPPEPFTVLPPDDELHRYEIPAAPQPYRLHPAVRRHKNTSFAILAEPESGRSRSPSPLRVSPFRGRGFNPAGSRHASPSPTPPVDSARPPTTRQSKIPKLTRRPSVSVFGEEITDFSSSPHRRKLHSQLSQSLTALTPSKRKKSGVRAPAFQKLSPIVGSSPEPSQSQSSPSKIPISQSQPASRLASPIRAPSTAKSNAANNTRNGTKKETTSPTKIPQKDGTARTSRSRTNSVRSNSSNNNKPKVPSKPPKPDSSSSSNNSKISRSGSRIQKKDSNSKLISKPGASNTEKSESKPDSAKTDLTSTPKSDATPPEEVAPLKSTESKDSLKSLHKTESSSKLMDALLPSTTVVVSNTTTTVTQPLKIDAEISSTTSSTPQKERKPVSPMVDGRVLSATSVSNAMNKMNDSVLDTQTLIKPPKISPTANAIIALAKEDPPKPIELNPALDTKNAAITSLPSIENEAMKIVENSNHFTTTGLTNSKLLEQQIQNNMMKLIQPDHVIESTVQGTISDRILQSNTYLNADIKPIKITVKEKPNDQDVQSGNIRNSSAMNGLSDRPGLPPSQPPSNHASTENLTPQKPPTFFNRLRSFFSRNKTNKNEENRGKVEEEKEEESGEKKINCFNLKKKEPDVKINIEKETPISKPKFWQRIKRNEPENKRRNLFRKKKDDKRNISFERRESVIQDAQPQTEKTGCKNFFKKMCCASACRKKKQEEDSISRRASMMSKKKSLTPSIPPEDNKPKLDMNLVEHTSHMKAAIPVLPLKLAWFCLVLNCIVPGLGTILSGLFCLCIGKPRFSQKDGPRPRIGAFLIDFIIGCGQFFTILFCLVGWGWSIWWGVIMVKIAKKQQKLALLEENVPQEKPSRQMPAVHPTNHRRDPESGH